MAAEHGPTAGEYIGHHLTHLQNKPMSGVIDFSVYNLDSIFWSILMGVLGTFFLWKAAKSATAGVPGRFQAAVEMLVEMVCAWRVSSSEMRSNSPRSRPMPVIS